MTIRLIKHEAVPKCGTYEVPFSDGRPSRYFYWDDEASRRLRPDIMDGEAAKQEALRLARTEQDKLDSALIKALNDTWLSPSQIRARLTSPTRMAAVAAALERPAHSGLIDRKTQEINAHRRGRGSLAIKHYRRRTPDQDQGMSLEHT